jgi:hypothetical protein
MDGLRLGRTGLNVKRVALGGIPNQQVSEEDAMKMAVCAGLNRSIRVPAIQRCHPFLIKSAMRRIWHGPRLCPKFSRDLHGLE